MGSLFKCKWHESLFNDIYMHEPPLQAGSSPIPRTRIWPIVGDDMTVTEKINCVFVSFWYCKRMKKKKQNVNFKKYQWLKSLKHRGMNSWLKKNKRKQRPKQNWRKVSLLTHQTLILTMMMFLVEILWEMIWHIKEVNTKHQSLRCPIIVWVHSIDFVAKQHDSSADMTVL